MSNKQIDPFLRRLLLRTVRVIFKIFGTLIFRPSNSGTEQIPRKGAVLFLGNHNSVMDAIFICAAVKRHIYFLTNERLFRKKILGKWISFLGAVSKRKMESDPRALREVIKLAAQGECIGIFPEGKRSWDGRTLPLLPGIGKLVLHLNIPVVFVVNETSFLHAPQWAKYKRWVPIRQRFSEPVYFKETMTPEEVETEIVNRIAIRPDQINLPFLSVGYSLAAGIENYLWACPICYLDSGLKVSGFYKDKVCCTGCEAKWELTIDQFLLPVAHTHALMHLTEAYDRITQHYINELTYRHRGTSVITREAEAAFYKQGNEPVLTISGSAMLRFDHIVFTDTDSVVIVRLNELSNLFVQEGKLYLNRGKEKYYLQMPGHCLLKWQFLIEQLQAVQANNIKRKTYDQNTFA